MSANLRRDDAEYVRRLVHRTAAIELDDSKGYLLESRLGQLARDRGFDSIHTLVAVARAGEPALDNHIVEAMATHETSFFRDSFPFEHLRREVLPAMAAARAGRRALTIWSAACSSGQEPYSLAMLVLESFPELVGWPVRIVATDLSEKIVARARAGRFSHIEVNRGLPATHLVRYFSRSGSEWEVAERVRSLVDVRVLNLLGGWDDLRPDVVFLRNVLIYFDVATRATILARLRAVMPPDGALFLGAAETTFGVDEAWERVDGAKASHYRVRA